MYKVRYYLSGGTLVSRYFKTFSEATLFSVYQVKTGDVFTVDLIKD
jgi:predicted Fe-Mo cluster-binding NifX family protein